MTEDHDKEEGFDLRPPPPCLYILTKAVLEASRAVLVATFEAHVSFAKRRLESCCFWYGTLINEHRCRVQAVVIPAQRNSWGNYHVSSAAMAEVSQATRPLGFLNLELIRK